jgi:kynurenine formamidase
MIGSMRVVDLTLPLDADTLMWPGSPQLVAETVTTIEHDGFYGRRLTVMEHAGTHFDAPCHMCEGGITVDRVPPSDLVAPIAMIDIEAELGGDPDGVLLPEHVAAWEARNGRVPERAAVFLRTGWERFNTDPARYLNRGGPLRFPGFGADAARILVDERGAVGLGIDTLGVDAGIATDFVVHKTVSHSKGLWHLENLTNLAQLPPVGAWVVIGVLKLTDGSGGPARVLSLVP